MPTLTLHPPAKHQTVSIIIEPGARLKVAAVLGAYDRCAVLYDKGVADIALDIAKAIPHAKAIAVKSGDASKSMAQAEKIIEQMLTAHCTRSSIVVCVGGGMMTDLGGFVASVFMRGIRVVHVPTSMLAMVDASIGGKTGVNAGSAKNIIGSIWHPTAVVIDTDLVEDLPDAQLHEGLVEVIKIAAVEDAEFFQWLEANMHRVLRKEGDAIASCIATAAGLKAHVVERDVDDREVRLILNFGHTVGHALEAASKFSLSHGAAVSIGMVAEMALGSFASRKRVTDLLVKVGMPTEIPKKFSPTQLLKLMKSDKKNASGKIRMAVPIAIGKAEVMELKESSFLQLFE